MVELFEASPLTYFVWEPKNNWKVASISQNILKNFWYNPNDFLSWKIKFADIVFPQDFPRIQKEVEQNLFVDKVKEFEQYYRVLDVNGKVCYIYDKTEVKYNEKWEVEKLYWYILDISETENANRLKDNYFKAIENSAIVQIVNKERIVVYVNDLYREVSWDYRDIEGMLASWMWWKKYHPSSFWKNLWDTILSWNVWSWIIQNPVINKPWESYFTITTITPIKNSEWVYDQFIAIKQNVTELKETQLRLVNILESTSQWFWSIDENLIIKHVNTAFCNMLGYTKDEVVWRSIYDFFDSSNRVILDKKVVTFKDSEHREYDIELLTKSWKNLPVKLIATTLRNSVWKFVEAVAFITDVSDIKELTFKDSLSWLYNRRYYNKIIDEQIQSVQDWQLWEFSLALLDIDYFKRINDSFWHTVWDEVIEYVWKVLLDISKNDDNYTVFRLWWEEFWVLWSWISLEKMKEVMERLRNHIQIKTHNFWWKKLNFTVSIWVTNIKKIWEHTTPEFIFNKADSALYFAKRSWRNNLKSSDDV